jgi:hypothetical protein
MTIYSLVTVVTPDQFWNDEFKITDSSRPCLQPPRRETRCCCCCEWILLDVALNSPKFCRAWSLRERVRRSCPNTDLSIWSALSFHRHKPLHFTQQITLRRTHRISTRNWNLSNRIEEIQSRFGRIAETLGFSWR